MTNVLSALNPDPQIRSVRHSCMCFIIVATLLPSGIELLILFSRRQETNWKKSCATCVVYLETVVMTDISVF
jgi:hypothetical protein